MKIGYFADGPWSHRAIELLSQKDGVEIVFIVPRFDTQDPVLKGWADKLQVPFLVVENVNLPESIEKFREFDADLFISMSFNQILKKEIINLPPNGFINCHAGALPFYRGRNPLNWVLINGENEFGITAHYIDEGIDTGDIISQKMFKISRDDNYETLLDKAVFECGNVLLEAVDLLQKQEVNPIKQNTIHPVGTYFGRRVVGDEYVDFNWSAERVFNFIRAISQPGPGARTFVDDKEVILHSAELIDGAPEHFATVGEVVGRADNGCVVKVGDSTVLIKHVEIVGAGEGVKKANFRIGTRFVSKNRG